MSTYLKRIGLLVIPLLFALPFLVSATPGVVENTDSGETFSSIQAAIDDADTVDGDTLEVGDGTYTEEVTIDKELTIQSENGTSSATVEGTITFEASSSTLNGFTVTQATGTSIANAVVVSDNAGDLTNVTIQNNHITGYTASSNGAGIWVEAGDSISILDNEISDLSSTGGTVQGILLGGTSDPDTTSNVSIIGNEIHDISGNPGGYGLMVNEASSNLVLRENHVHNIFGERWGSDFGLDADTEHAVIELNTLEQLDTNEFPGASIGVIEQSSATVPTITLRQNNLVSEVGIENRTDGDLVAEENWWNSQSGPHVVDGSGSTTGNNGTGTLAVESRDGNIDVSPWLCDEAPSNATTTDGECPDDEDDEDEGDDEAEVEKVAVCHAPPGNPDNAHTIYVGQPAVDAHEAHGDTVGECEDTNEENDEKRGNGRGNGKARGQR